MADAVSWSTDELGDTGMAMRTVSVEALVPGEPMLGSALRRPAKVKGTVSGNKSKVAVADDDVVVGSRLRATVGGLSASSRVVCRFPGRDE